MKLKRTPEQNRRYKLHQKIKERFEYYAKKRTVIIPHDYNLECEFLKELRDKFRYNIQYSIISPNTIEVINPEIQT
ncbi:hypothetical protein QWY99_06200 [Flavobacterium branchiarum]|uniref:hypothetical protein n=1 Tax=Flavobacterium branchiarum TaxID=1114870 RepID=UPI0025B4F191|nr:hypothetical protein [Flavobacterium branchiarum]MDN3672645.1 hypothetical protein [Flavobacterium branchiarum]